MLIERETSSRRWLYACAIAAVVALLALLALGGCAAGKPGPTPTPTKTRMPTFTPVKGTASAPALAVAATITPVPAATALPPEPSPTAAPPTAEPTATPPPSARLTVSSATANLRGGPGTGYGTVGTARQGDGFEVIGRNAAGDWWQINANGDAAWVAASIVSVENPELVAVAQNIPAPPVAAVAPPAKAPAPTQAPAPPPAADPCANIGGDGCKWKVVGGPQTAENGGQELKLQFLFMHSGIDGGQPQGSYFVVMVKDGQQLPVPDNVRSIARVASDGSMGKYNYELSIGVDKLPGHTVAGNYTLWVLDGNGERDSRNLNFTISGNQGLLYIKFDQA